MLERVASAFGAGGGAHIDASGFAARATSSLKRSPARLVVGELVEARAGRREQHDVAGRAPRARGRASGALEVAAAARRPTAAPRRSALLADEVHAGAALGDGRAQRREVLALALPAERSGGSALSKLASATSVEATFVAFESLT